MGNCINNQPTNEEENIRDKIINEINSYLQYFNERKNDIAFELGVCIFPHFHKYPISVIEIAEKYFNDLYIPAINENTYSTIGTCQIYGWSKKIQFTKEQTYTKTPIYYRVCYENGKDVKRMETTSYDNDSDKTLYMIRLLHETEIEYDIRLLTTMKKTLEDAYENYNCYKYWKVNIVRAG